MKRFPLLFVTVFFLPFILYASGDFNWKELPALPFPPGDNTKPVLTGFFAGMQNDVLILAGGESFPDSAEIIQSGFKSRFEKNIYLLPDGGTWILAKAKLENSLGYGVSIPTSEGLLCIGGERPGHKAESGEPVISDKVILLRHTGEANIEIDFTSFPPIPEPLTFLAGAKIGKYIYLTGGYNGRKATKTFLRLDLNNKEKWEELESWPGMPRLSHVLIAQNDGAKNCLYLFGGRTGLPGNSTTVLRDAYKYDPEEGIWTELSTIGAGNSDKHFFDLSGAAAFKTGANHIAISGSRAVLYHTITDTWVKSQKFPGYIEGLYTTAVQHDDGVIIPGGSYKKDGTSLNMWIVTPELSNSFGFVNYIVLGLYLGALVAMGLYFLRREKSTDDFFKAGGRIPWWAAGLSIFGTQLSAITFMAIPAKSYATDWTWFIMNMTIVAVAPLIIFLFLPFYRRLNVTTAYEYIEKRFSVVVRAMASAMFILFQFARIGIVLFLPSIALSIVTGIDIRLCIAAMGLLSILYTVMGGIEAVIWTDVLQVIVLLGGALLVLIIIPDSVPGGIGGMVDLAQHAEKLRLFNLHFSLESPTLWVLVLGGIGANLISYGSDQAVIQRYLTTKNEKEAARGIWTNAVLTIPATVIFFALGTALYTFFKSNPETLTPALNNADAILPWFIVSQLPAGIAGLLIAGIFAASMSSLDSSMNSVAAAFTTDFYRRFKPAADEKKYLNIARTVTIVIGLCGMLFALIMATWDIKSLWEEFATFIGLFGGGLGGLFLLAIFTKRTNSKGAVAGLIVSAVVQYFLSANAVVHGVLYAATGMISCVITGYLVSLLMPLQDKDLSGLTLHSIKN